MQRAKQYRMPTEDVDKLVARIPKQLGEEIRTIAENRGVSLNTIMVEAFELYIRRSGKA